jgi:hypothetical protein
MVLFETAPSLHRYSAFAGMTVKGLEKRQPFMDEL